MAEYMLQWKSTAEERYDTDMCERAREVVDNSKVKVLDDFGGTDLFTGQSDNGFDVETDEATARDLANAIGAVIGKNVTVTELLEEPTE